MPDRSKATGRCLCGAVKITLAGDHREVGACHCGMCRRWGGGPGMAIEVGKDLEIEGAEHLTTYRSSDWAERAFCRTCGSSLYYRLVEAGDCYLFAGILDDQSEMVLTSQIFIDEKPTYYAFANDTKTMTGAEVLAAFASPDDKDA